MALLIKACGLAQPVPLRTIGLAHQAIPEALVSALITPFSTLGPITVRSSPMLAQSSKTGPFLIQAESCVI